MHATEDFVVHGSLGTLFLPLQKKVKRRLLRQSQGPLDNHFAKNNKTLVQSTH